MGKSKGNINVIFYRIGKNKGYVHNNTPSITESSALSNCGKFTKLALDKSSPVYLQMKSCKSFF